MKLEHFDAEQAFNSEKALITETPFNMQKS